jgi:virginiamycin B lyase
MREITVPGWSPYALAAAPDGSVWMSVLEPAGLARLEPAAPDGSEVILHALPAKPLLVAAGADGTVWHSSQDDRIGSDGTTWFDLPAGAAPYGIVAADGGGAWFTAPGINRVGRISPGGRVETVEVPLPGAYPAMLTVAEDGAVWAALNAAGALLRWADGVLQIVDVPDGRTAAAPVGIAADGDRVWFADIAGGSVGLAGADGEIERVTFDDPACRPHAVAVAPGGGCWVTLWGSGSLARVAPDHEVSIVELPGREPHGLAVIGDEVWVAMESGAVVRVPSDG